MTEIDDSTIAARKQLAMKYATKFGIDVALICAVAHHESCGWNKWATRYEPEFYIRYIEPMLHGGLIHTDTEARERSTSWGLMQVMGQTAREFGFMGKFLAELCDPDVGLEFGCRKLRHCLDKHNGDVKQALLSYNGGGDPDYPSRVMAWIPTYSTHT